MVVGLCVCIRAEDTHGFLRLGRNVCLDTYMIHHMVFMIVKRSTIRVIKRTDHVAHINTRL